MKPPKSFIKESSIKSLSDLQTWAKNFVTDYYFPKTLLVLEGEMGAGKTETVKQLASVLGLASVSSPTYAVLQNYAKSGVTGLHHVDMYRLKDIDDLESTGFWDLFNDIDSFIIVEWGDMVEVSAYPLNWKHLHLKITKDSNGLRKYTLSRFF
ncbi:MAG: tRNA (adenosine(37)-N6)-threonylcarbamoyltransferase complex ATPase subunit type 1 TsaE [Bdellovibrionota bacterium]